MALKTNEGTVCDAVVRHLESRTKVMRSEVWHPEKSADNEVELAWKLGDRQYVIEHTVIEPFEDFLRLNAQAQAHFDPIIQASSNLVPDVLELEVPACCMQDMDRHQRAAVQAVLIAHILGEAPKLPLRRYCDYIGAEKPATIAGVPFAFRLFRFENITAASRLQVKHIAPDVATERAQRIERACEDKFPKLAAWKKQGARTILVFEDNDIQLTNPARVAEVFEPVARNRGDAPDETYMVATCMEPWQLWPLLVDGKSYFDLGDEGLGGNIPIDESKLDWITGKRGS
jgi:hypothetical protein